MTIITSCSTNSMESDAKKLAKLMWESQKLANKVASGDMSVVAECTKVTTEANAFATQMELKYLSDAKNKAFNDAVLKELNNCSKELKSTDNNENSQSNVESENEADDSPDGYYSFEANQIKCEITITGNSYVGYNQMGNQTETLSGKISGKDLLGPYDVNTVGHIGDGYITYGPYTLNKNN